MGLQNLALAKTDDFPIRHEGNVHSGKVRSVYWLNSEDSQRLIEENNYPVFSHNPLGLLIISDRISAFDCNWKAKEGLDGVPGKGAALNAISKYWFDKFDESGLAENHILDVPHPLVWMVQKAEPIMVEAISRQYLTGSMGRYYNKGQREICGITLPDGLKKNQRFDELLITPSTKGIMRGIPGVPEEDDVNITGQQIIDNYEAFGFKSPEDIAKYETFLIEGSALAEKRLAEVGQIFVDTKFEFGYVPTLDGKAKKMIYIDEVLTPDSSRFWDTEAYNKGVVVENSKEGFRQFLLTKTGLERDVLLNKKRMDERKQVAAGYKVAVKDMMDVSNTYTGIAETITGVPVTKIENAREEILDALSKYGVVA